MALRTARKTTGKRGHRIVTQPADEPVSVGFMESWGRIEDDTNILESLITMARQYIEQITGLAMVTQQWRLTLDEWPYRVDPWWDGVRQMPVSELRSNRRSGEVELPRYPLQDIDSITVDGDPINVPSLFIVDNQQPIGKLVIRAGATWPVVHDVANGIDIVYTAGFGEPSDVPEPLKIAVATLALYLYEHRGDCSAEDAYLNSGAMTLVQSYKVTSI